MLRWLAAIAGGALLLSACGGGSSSGSQEPIVAVTFSPPDLVVESSPDNDQRGGPIRIWVSGTDGPLWIGWSASLNALARVELSGADLSNLNLGVRFKPVGVLPNGTHVDRITVDICEDQECARPLPGSPFTLSATVKVSGSPATSMPETLSRPARAALTHDVIAAAMSRPLNAIVMASALPDPALYLYDLATGKERRVPLSQAPTGALALSLDGKKAAIGHDGAVSWVDLPSMRTAEPRATRFGVPMPVFDLVVDGGKTIHVFPASGQWVDLHSIDATSGASWTTSIWLYEATRARLHPSGDSFYMLDTQLWPQNFERFMLDGSGSVGAQRIAPYWGDYATCSDFWFSDAGHRIYSACGNSFTSSDDAAQDMLYAGRLPVIDTGRVVQQTIVALADSAKSGRLAFLDRAACLPDALIECDTYLRLVDASSGKLLSTHWPPPLGDERGWHWQRGVLLGYAGDGTLYMISRLIGAADASRAFYVSAPLQERVAPTAAKRDD